MRQLTALKGVLPCRFPRNALASPMCWPDLFFGSRARAQLCRLRRAPIQLREADLAPQRRRASRTIAAGGRAASAEADRIRDRLFHGWRRGADALHLRSG